MTRPSERCPSGGTSAPCLVNGQGLKYINRPCGNSAALRSACQRLRPSAPFAPFPAGRVWAPSDWLNSAGFGEDEEEVLQKKVQA